MKPTGGQKEEVKDFLERRHPVRSRYRLVPLPAAVLFVLVRATIKQSLDPSRTASAEGSLVVDGLYILKKTPEASADRVTSQEQRQQ